MCPQPHTFHSLWHVLLIFLAQSWCIQCKQAFDASLSSSKTARPCFPCAQNVSALKRSLCQTIFEFMLELMISSKAHTITQCKDQWGLWTHWNSLQNQMPNLLACWLNMAGFLWHFIHMFFSALIEDISVFDLTNQFIFCFVNPFQWQTIILCRKFDRKQGAKHSKDNAQNKVSYPNVSPKEQMFCTQIWNSCNTLICLQLAMWSVLMRDSQGRASFTEDALLSAWDQLCD